MTVTTINNQSSFFRHQVPLVKITRISLNKRSLMSASRIAKYGLGLNNVPPTARVSLVRRPSVLVEHQRNYPGEFQARMWQLNLKHPVNPHERDDLGLTEHQATHINIEHTDTEIITMIFTSAHKSKDPNVHIEKLSPIKANGSFTPLKDAKTGKLVYDHYGNLVPDPDKGGQYVAVLITPRKLGDDVKHLAPIGAKLQAYLDQHEVALKRILENAKAQRSSNLVKYVGNKDGE